MIIDCTRGMEDHEYEDFMDLMDKRFNQEHRSCPDAPCWGDGPNTNDDDDEYEDSQYNEYYENLLTYEEKLQCEEIENRVLDFKNLMNSWKEWKEVYSFHMGSIPHSRLAKFLVNYNYQYIMYFNPLNFDYYLYLKGEQAQIHYYLEFNGWKLDYAEIMRVRYDWIKLDITFKYHEDGFEDYDAVLHWLNKCNGTVTFNKNQISTSDVRMVLYFQNKKEAIHFKMVV
jgi:hypothetical protein